MLVGMLVSLALVAGGCTEAKDDAPEAQVGARTWASGVWLGGATDAKTTKAFGRWRGSAVDTVTTYPAYDTWQDMKDSEWHVTTFDGFQGRLVYGLPLLPSQEPATLAEVARGDHDDVWRTVARTLVKHDRGNAYVRIGLEANGRWFPWGATADTADEFKAAYRHVAKVMAKVGPKLRFVFDISCGVALRGADDRMAALTDLYPGDDVVDIIGCDHYDSWSAIARNEDQWADSITPSTGPGLTDLVEFAADHDKKFAIPEWGLTSKQENGAGDNPFFMKKMYQFFWKNRSRLAFENYFDEPGPSLGSSLFLEDQNPRSAEVYRELW